MLKALAIAKLAVLIALASLCVGGCFVTVKLVRELDAMKATTEKLSAEVDAVTLTTRELSTAKTGIIPLVQDDLRNFRLTLDNANKAAIDERFFLEHAQPVELARINKILDSSNELVTEATRHGARLSDEALADLQAADDTIRGLDPLEAKLGTTVESLTATTKDLDKLVGDPENVKTLANVQAGTRALAETSKEGQQWFYQVLHPTWPQKIYHLTIDLAHALL
jgi:prefoldin subunit 5